ncbi:MAG: hypothetical protein K2Y40_05330 [Reyranella sp.]|nr:hypothetical protein [Reyranella sp.]
MDGAQKRVALVVESAQGTTPATPGFLTLRDSRLTGDPVTPRSRSPERSNDRTARATYRGLTTYAKTLEMPLAYDPALHELFSSLFQADYATNVLKNGSTIQPLTLEEKLENGATDLYFRSVGAFVESMSLQASNGQPAQLSFGIRHLSHATDSAIISGATYAAPDPGDPPMTPADFLVNNGFGLTAPKVQSLTLNIRNNAYDIFGFGSNEPSENGLGQLDIEGSISLYFKSLAQYTAFLGAGGTEALDITMGSVATNKYQLQIPKCDVWNPQRSDPGPSGPIMLDLTFMGTFSAADSAAIVLTKAVA